MEENNKRNLIIFCSFSGNKNDKHSKTNPLQIKFRISLRSKRIYLTMFSDFEKVQKF